MYFELSLAGFTFAEELGRAFLMSSNLLAESKNGHIIMPIFTVMNVLDVAIPSSSVKLLTTVITGNTFAGSQIKYYEV